MDKNKKRKKFYTDKKRTKKIFTEYKIKQYKNIDQIISQLK